MRQYRYLAAVVVGYAGLNLVLWYYPFPSDNPFLVLMADHSAGRLANAAYWMVKVMYWVMAFAVPADLTYTVWGWFTPKGKAIPKRRTVLVDTPPEQRKELYVAVGEIHHAVEPGPSPNPRLAVIPKKSLFCCTGVFGTVGSGKSSAVLMPMEDQLIRQGVGGLILDPNGDLQRHAAATLHGMGRRFINVGPDGWSYNPLAGNFEPHTLAMNITGLISSLRGEAKDNTYWRDSYTAAATAFIRLNLLAMDYLTFVDLYECLFDERLVTERMSICRRLLEQRRVIKIRKTIFEDPPNAPINGVEGRSYRQTLRTRYGFREEAGWPGYYVGEWSRRLVTFLGGPAVAPHPRFDLDQWEEAYERDGSSPSQKVVWLDRFEFFYQHDWNKRDESNRTNVATSLGNFLMMIWDNDEVRALLCPPREAYEAGWQGRPVLTSMEVLTDDGEVGGITIPLDWSSDLRKTIMVLAKLNFQLAVQQRMVPVGSDIKPTMLIVDEFPMVATTTEKSSIGDDVFMSTNTRRGACCFIGAAQTIKQIEALGGLFKNIIFMNADPATAEYGRKRCGSHWDFKDSLSLSESNQRSRSVMMDDHLQSQDGGTGLSRSWSQHHVPVYDDCVFMSLANNEAIAALYDGRRYEVTRLYLRPSYLGPHDTRSYFELQAAGVL